MKSFTRIASVSLLGRGPHSPRLLPFQHASRCLRVAVSTVAALGAFSAISNVVHGEISLEHGSVSLKAELDSEYDSNIYSNRSETSDWHSVLAPSANFVRDAGLLRLDAKGGVQLQHFQDHHSEDSTDPFVQGSARWKQDEGKFEGAFDTSLRRFSEANVDVNARTRVETFGANALVKHFPAEKLGYQLDGSFYDENFLVRGMSDIRTQALNAEARYHFSPKADVFVGAGGRWSDTYHVPAGLMPNSSVDTKLKVGVDGELLSKFTGRVAFGYVHRRFRTAAGGSQSGALLDTSLTWHPDDETSVTLIANRDFDTTPVDQSVTRLVTGIEVWRQIREKLRVMAGVSHSASSYVGVGVSRKDTIYSGRLGASYSLTRHWTAGAHVSYADTASNIAIASYSRLIAGLSAALTF